MIDIDKNLNGYELRNALYKLQSENQEDYNIKILFNLINDDLTSLEPFKDTEIKEGQISNINILEITDNLEILARWYDLLQHLKIDVEHSAIAAYSNYMLLYNESHRDTFALRAFLIVNLKKSIFKKQLNSISEVCCSVLLQLNSSYTYKIIVSVVKMIINEDCNKCISNDANNKFKNSLNNNKFNDAIDYTDSLELLGAIDKKQCKKQKSMILEKNGDYFVSNKQPNTYYPYTAQLYKKAIREIANLEDCKNDTDRLSLKLQEEELEMSKAMQILGQSNKQTIDLTRIHEYILNILKSCGPLYVYKNMVNFPLTPKEFIVYQREQSKSEHQFLYNNFNEFIRNDFKGATVGIKEGDDAIDNQLRDISQSLMIKYIDIFLYYIQTSDNFHIDMTYIYDHLNKLNCKFIPGDRLCLYAQGLYCGLCGDYSLSAYILLPQFENSFRYIAKQHGIITTQYTKDIENQNTMGGVLAKIRPYTNEDLWEELNHFLISGTNFRNEAMHGLLSHSQMSYYGVYLLWLCLKIIYNTDSYFGFNKSK